MSELNEQAAGQAVEEEELESASNTNVDLLFNVALGAGVVGWLILAVYLINTGLVIYSVRSSWAAIWADKMNGIGTLISMSQGLLVGLSFFFMLQGVRYGLLALADLLEKDEEA